MIDYITPLVVAVKTPSPRVPTGHKGEGRAERNKSGKHLIDKIQPPANRKPDYKDQSAQSKIVIWAGIAEIQMPWMASAEHILALWIRFAVFGSGNPCRKDVVAEASL